jgi:hypothetical protein
MTISVLLKQGDVESEFPGRQMPLPSRSAIPTGTYTVTPQDFVISVRGGSVSTGVERLRGLLLKKHPLYLHFDLNTNKVTVGGLPKGQKVLSFGPPKAVAAAEPAGGIVDGASGTTECADGVMARLGPG